MGHRTKIIETRKNVVCCLVGVMHLIVSLLIFFKTKATSSELIKSLDASPMNRDKPQIFLKSEVKYMNLTILIKQISHQALKSVRHNKPNLHQIR